MKSPPDNEYQLDTILAMSTEQAEILKTLQKIDVSLTQQESLVGHLQRCADDGSLTPTPEWVGRMLRLTLLTASAMGVDPQVVFAQEMSLVAKAVAAGEKFDGNPYWRTPICQKT